MPTWINCFLSVRVHLNEELTFLKLSGKRFYYSCVMDGSGVTVRDIWSGFVKVQNREIIDPVFFEMEDIVRKLKLCTSLGMILLLLIFRGNLRASVNVPVYPQNGDMLLSQAEGINNIWHDHVHSTDYTKKTVDVYL